MTNRELSNVQIAVQNLTKMAGQKGYGVKSEKLAEDRFRVTMEISEAAAAAQAAGSSAHRHRARARILFRLLILLPPGR